MAGSLRINVRRGAGLWLACGLAAALSIRPGPILAQSTISSLPDTAALDSAFFNTPAVESLAVEDPAAAPAPPPDYLSEIRTNFTPRSRAYSDIKTVLRFLSPMYAVAIGFLILFSGLAAGMRDLAHGLGRSRWVRVLVFLAAYAAVLFVAQLPLTWFDDFAVERQYQLSRQTLGDWLGDQVKGVLVGVFFLGVVPLVWVAYTAIAKSPRRWWLWLGLTSLPLIAAGVLVHPLVVEPLFGSFRRLGDQNLERRIVALAERADIPARRVLQVDKSTQTEKYNAYVSGFGASQRIVLWDTTLRGLTEDEILFVMGHEIGHYRLGHIWRGIAVTAATSLLLFFCAERLSVALLARFGHRWGFRHLSDVASMPLLALSLTLIVFLAQPLVHAYTRGIETEADLYGLELTRDNDAAARAFLKLGAQNKSNPEPSAFVRWVLYSHPPDAERLRLAMTYRPWERGEPNRYFRTAR